MSNQFTKRICSVYPAACEPFAPVQGRIAPRRASATPLSAASVRGSSIGPIHILSVIPLLDVVIGQVQSVWELQIGPLSLPQVYHALVLMIVIAIGFSRLSDVSRLPRFVLISVAGFTGSLSLSCVALLIEGRMSLETLVAVFQIIYWIVVWVTVLVVCRTRAQARTILKGIAAAGIYAAVWVLYLYFSKGEEASIYTDIVGNAAGLSTAKGLTGIIITGGLVAVWMSAGRWKLPAMLAFFVCVIGTLLTYQRAGLVGSLVALGWLIAWCVTRARFSPRSGWAQRAIIVAIVGCAIVLAAIGTEDLQRRWSDMYHPEKAGSGRLAFWQIAVDRYLALDWASKLCGIGYTATADALNRHYGVRIHTHSDLLDMLLMFGMVGLLGFLGVCVAILRLVTRSRSSPSVFALGMAICLLMLCQGALTGQALSPSVMSCYLMAITCACMHHGYRRSTTDRDGLTVRSVPALQVAPKISSPGYAHR